jgi:hypothetical protein
MFSPCAGAAADITVADGIDANNDDDDVGVNASTLGVTAADGRGVLSLDCTDTDVNARATDAGVDDMFANVVAVVAVVVVVVLVVVVVACVVGVQIPGMSLHVLMQ